MNIKSAIVCLTRTKESRFILSFPFPHTRSLTSADLSPNPGLLVYVFHPFLIELWILDVGLVTWRDPVAYRSWFPIRRPMMRDLSRLQREGEWRFNRGWRAATYPRLLSATAT